VSEVLFGIFGGLVQLGIMGGIVFLIVKAVSGHKKTSTESGGVHIRRFFVYLLMLAMLILVGLGVAGLIDAVLPASGVITDSSAAAARSISFVIVGLPIYAGLALYTARRLSSDPNEQSSAGWAFYLIVSLIGSLIAAMSLIGALLSDVAGGDGPERTIAIHAVVWMTVWVAHWFVAQRYPPPKGAQIHLLAGSTVGLIWAFTGAIATVTALLSTVYDELFLSSITGNSIGDLLRPAAILAVGLTVWWWYWLRHTLHSERTPLWHAYALLLGVMGGVVSAITGAGIMLYGVLHWFLGDVSDSAGAHFDLLPGALAALFVGTAVWAYHAHVVGDRDDRSRGEIDRVYDYLVSGAGLMVAASGVATLIATALMAVSGRNATATDSGDTVAVALTLLLIGVPLWWRYWSTIQRYRHVDASGELGSVTRRIYIVALFGVAAVVAVVSLIVIVFILVEDILDGAVGPETLDASAVAIALLITAGALSWYHFAVFREDRSDIEVEDDETPTVPEEPVDRLIPHGSLEQALEALADSGHVHAKVTRRTDGYEVEPQ
jgi:hypothetical protein